MIKIGICDDSEEIIEWFVNIIKKIADEESVFISIRTFNSGENLLFELDEQVNELDILYMDIEMKTLNGIQTAKKLREKGCQSILIFLTDRSKYVFKSFDVMPFQYLLKSQISYEECKRIFINAISEKKTTDEELFTCEYKDIKKIFKLRDICYFEVQNRIITLHTMSETFTFYAKLETIKEQIHNRWFIRIHRSILVNLYYVDRIMMKSVVMKNKEELPIGSTYLKDVKQIFSQYLLEKI